MSNDAKLGEYLVVAGMITERQLKTATDYQKSTGGSLQQILVKLGFIDDLKLTELLAMQEDLQVCDIGSMVLPVELVKSIPADVISKFRVIPIHKSHDVITLAVADPHSAYEAIEHVQFVTGKRVEIQLAPRDDLERAIQSFFDTMEGTAVDPMLKELSEPELKAFSGKKKGKESEVTPKVRPEKRYEALVPALIPVLIDKGLVTEQELKAKLDQMKKSQ